MSPKNKKKRLKTKQAKPFDPDAEKSQPKFIDKGISFTSVSIHNQSGPEMVVHEGPVCHESGKTMISTGTFNLGINQNDEQKQSK